MSAIRRELLEWVWWYMIGKGRKSRRKEHFMTRYLLVRWGISVRGEKMYTLHPPMCKQEFIM